MMLKSLLKKAYYSIPFSLRMPKVYYDALSIGEGVKSLEEIREWQLNKFKEIFEYAYDSVPGYYQLYHEAGIIPQDIQSVEDILNVPILTKEIMMANIDEFVSSNVPSKKRIKSTTSGSTGQPFVFSRTSDEEWIEQAFVAKAWSYGGWNIKQSGIMLRGAYSGDEMHIVKKCDNSNFYVHNGSYMLSPNFLDDNHYNVYRDFLRSHKELSYFFALPSSITLLSKLIVSHEDKSFNNIMGIYLSSESLYEWQYKIINEAFPNANIISLYGQSERLIMAYWCKNSHQYHIDPFYGYTEILNGNTPVNVDEQGELVGTSFWNKTTPFIRYRTKDYATKGRVGCPDCGLQYELLDSIDGRKQDVLVSKSGRKILYTVFDGSFMHGELFRDIVQYKFIQYSEGELILAIKGNHFFLDEKMKDFEIEITKYFGSDFHCVVKRVESFIPSANGKFNIVEQHMKVTI